MKLASVIVASCLFLQLAGGKDLYWQPNSNWGNPSNWALGRVPNCKDDASLTSVPEDSVVFLDVDATVQSLSLPVNGQLVLGSSVTIQLSSDKDCTVTVPGDTQPMAASIKNNFIGASVEYWECPDNWLTADDSPAEHAPCGDDRAIFDKGFFSYVRANASITVRSLSLRGTEVNSLAELNSAEFDFPKGLIIESDCAVNPDLCSCPDDSKCPKPVFPSVVISGASTSNLGGIIGGVAFCVIVILAIVSVFVVIGVIYLHRRKKQGMGYMKDDLLDESDLGQTSVDAPIDAEGGGGGGGGGRKENLYDNPLFEEKVDLSLEVAKLDLGEMLDDMPPATTYNEEEVEPADEPEAGGKERVPVLNKYQRF